MYPSASADLTGFDKAHSPKKEQTHEKKKGFSVSRKDFVSLFSFFLGNIKLFSSHWRPDAASEEDLSISEFIPGGFLCIYR